MKFMIAILLMTTPSFAAIPMEGSGVRGGGDELGLEFSVAAQAAILEAGRLDAGLAAVLQSADAAKIAATMEIIATDAPLVEFSKGSYQEFVAINEPARGRVYVNRDRWAALGEIGRRGIALHEVLSLARLEETGRYDHSARYLALLGVDAGVLSVRESNRLVLGCADENGGVFGLRWGADRVLRIETKARSEAGLARIRAFARFVGISGWDRVDAMSLRYNPSIHSAPCNLEVFRGARFQCWLDEGAPVHFYVGARVIQARAPRLMVWGSGSAGDGTISFGVTPMLPLADVVAGLKPPRVSQTFLSRSCR